MYKSFSSFSHLRILTLLLLLLSSDVHPNPGPIRSVSRLTSNDTISFTGLNNLNYYLSLIVSNGGAADNGYNITFSTAESSSNNISVRLSSQDTYIYPPIFLGQLSNITFQIVQTNGNVTSRFNFTLFPSTSSTVPVPLNVKVINSSIEPVPTLPVISNPVPVSLINPSVLPVQIENIDPIEVEFAIGEPLPVSIINPTVFPVQIDNIDPIEVTIPTTAPIAVTGTVSIANPIPSVASTILNAFKK
jgi:hypothetical protein